MATFEKDLAKQNESEDFYQRHAHEHKQRTFREIIDINKANEKLNQPGEPVVQEKKSPASEKRIPQGRDVLIDPDYLVGA